MSLMVAPYIDSMRLGMGFNSYDQTLCIDGAVDIKILELVRMDNPSQVVSYSSKYVERLSEVVDTMKVSHSSSIRKGTVELAGNGDAINEDKIKSSDINAVISVKVVNQTMVLRDSAQFQPMKGYLPGTSKFNDAYGDCYISGFVTGGEVNSIVSMRVLDRSKTVKTVDTIKKGLRSVKGAAEFSLDLDSDSSMVFNSEALKDTETTITVSWMGGGQIKEPNTPWTLATVYQAAEAFPALVARCPQRTWAILTKYKANKSFMQNLAEESFSPLEYDLVAEYTSNLFDNYMEYKQLVKAAQDIMTNPGNYNRTHDVDAILPEDLETLVDARNIFRGEMNKIVQAVDLLSKDPRILKSSKKLASVPANSKIRGLVNKYSKKATAAPQKTSLTLDPSDQAVAKFDDSDQSIAPKQGDNSTVMSRDAENMALIVEEQGKDTALVMPPPAAAATSGSQAKISQAQDFTSSSAKDSTESSDAQDQSKGHDQWVYLTYSEKSAKGEAVGADGKRPAGWYRAWVGTDPKLLDTSQLPEKVTDDGDYKLVYVYDSKTPIPAGQDGGELTKAWVPDSGTDEDTDATADGQTTGTKVEEKQITSQGDKTVTASMTGRTDRGNATDKNGATDMKKIGSDDKVTQPARKLATEDISSTEVSKRAIPTVAEREMSLDFDMMIAPEIWSTVMPTAKLTLDIPSTVGASIMPSSLAVNFPMAPQNDLPLQRSKDIPRLEILLAACGVVDCTGDIRGLVTPNGDLKIDTSRLPSLLAKHTPPQRVSEGDLFLSFIFRYDDGPMRLFTHTPMNRGDTQPLDVGKVYNITLTDSANFPEVRPLSWSEATWSILAIVYAGKHLIDPGQVGAITSQIEKNYDNGKGTRHVDIRSSLLAGTDPTPGRRKSSAIFYQIQASGLVSCAVGIEDQTPCMLTDRLLPDILDPSQKISMDTTVDQLKKDIAEKDSQIQMQQRSWDWVKKDLVEKESEIKSLQVTSNTVKTLEAEITKLKQDIQAKDAQIKNAKPFAAADMTPTTRFVLSKLETAANAIPDSLHYNWNGMRVALANRKSHRVIDWGRGATAYLYSDAMYDFGNHTVTLKQEGNPAAQIFWWSLLVLNGEALELQADKIVHRPADGYNTGQQWYLTRGSDYLSVCIRPRNRPEIYLTADSENLIVGFPDKNDWPRSEWQLKIMVKNA